MNYNFNGTIQQNGQPISGGGIYEHVMSIKDNGNTTHMNFRFVCSVKSPFTNAGDFLAWLKSIPYNSSHYFVAMWNPQGSSTAYYNQVIIIPWSNYANIYDRNTATGSTSYQESIFNAQSEISDTVYEL